MSNRISLPKWPFILADVLLVGLALWIGYASARPIGLWQAGLCLAGIGAGAWTCIYPFLQEYRASLRILEAEKLVKAMDHVEKLETIQRQIAGTASFWQSAQSEASSVVQAAGELARQVQTEAKDFKEFLQKADSAEKAHLRLEVEKLRKAEGDWLQVTVRILDHVFVLNQAALRSGQPTLIAQLRQFQNACWDITRRVGLTPFCPAPQEEFNAHLHQTVNGETAVPGARVLDTLATGYTYQGQLLRKAVVALPPAEPVPRDDGAPAAGGPQMQIDSERTEPTAEHA